jgi:thymidylate kinase
MVLAGIVGGTGFRNRIRRTAMAAPYNPRSVMRIWPYFAFADSILTYLVRLRTRSRNEIVICDRYFYDIMAIWACVGMLSFRSAYVFSRAIPRPTVLVMLTADPVVAYARKKEHSLIFYRVQSDFYRGLEAVLGVKAIDTGNLAINDVRRRIMDRVGG